MSPKNEVTKKYLITRDEEVFTDWLFKSQVSDYIRRGYIVEEIK